MTNDRRKYLHKGKIVTGYILPQQHTFQIVSEIPNTENIKKELNKVGFQFESDIKSTYEQEIKTLNTKNKYKYSNCKLIILISSKVSQEKGISNIIASRADHCQLLYFIRNVYN